MRYGNINDVAYSIAYLLVLLSDVFIVPHVIFPTVLLVIKYPGIVLSSRHS